MKTKMRGKVRPKMGKIDIDYQKLHDAFFKLVNVSVLHKASELLRSKHLEITVHVTFFADFIP